MRCLVETTWSSARPARTPGAPAGSFLFILRKPSKVKRPVSRPDTASAAVNALGGDRQLQCRAQHMRRQGPPQVGNCRHSLHPIPLHNFSRRQSGHRCMPSGNAHCAHNSVDQFLLDPKIVQEFCRYPGVFRRNKIHRPQRFLPSGEKNLTNFLSASLRYIISPSSCAFPPFLSPQRNPIPPHAGQRQLGFPYRPTVLKSSIVPGRSAFAGSSGPCL